MSQLEMADQPNKGQADDFAADLHSMHLEEETLIEDQSTELNRIFTSTTGELAKTTASIIGAQRGLQEELDIMLIFWEKRVQGQGNKFAKSFASKLQLVERIQTFIQQLSGQVVDAVEKTAVEKKDLEELDIAFNQLCRDCRSMKRKCQDTHTQILAMKNAYRDVSKQIKGEQKVVREKKSQTNKLDVTVQRMGSDHERAATELAQASSSLLDDSFGPHFKEIETILGELSWDFDEFTALLRDRDEFLQRIARVRADSTGKERARQHEIQHKKHAELKAENDRLHHLQAGLKIELISAERDLEIAAGISHVRLRAQSPV